MPVTVASGAAPPPAGSAKKSQASGTPRQTKRKEREESVQGIFQLAAMGLIARKEFADAGAISLHAEKISKEIVDLGEKNERVGQALEQLMQVGPYAGLVGACMPLVLQFLVNHDKAQAGVMGTVGKTALEANVKTQLAKMEMESLKAQREAEAELRAMSEAMDNDSHLV